MLLRCFFSAFLIVFLLSFHCVPSSTVFVSFFLFDTHNHTHMPPPLLFFSSLLMLEIEYASICANVKITRAARDITFVIWHKHTCFMNKFHLFPLLSFCRCCCCCCCYGYCFCLFFLNQTTCLKTPTDILSIPHCV